MRRKIASEIRGVNEGGTADAATTFRQNFMACYAPGQIRLPNESWKTAMKFRRVKRLARHRPAHGERLIQKALSRRREEASRWSPACWREIGWGGRIRTFTILINSEVSYRLDHAPAATEETSPNAASRRISLIYHDLPRSPERLLRAYLRPRRRPAHTARCFSRLVRNETDSLPPGLHSRKFYRKLSGL